jgi:PAS domain S-box-containing protein
MDTDRNLLIGVLVLQAGWIDSKQFVEACTIWTTRKEVALVDLLLERGWILAGDVAHIEYLLERKLTQHGGDTKATIAAVSDDVKRYLASLDDPEVQQSLTHVSQPEYLNPTITMTLDIAPKSPQRYMLTHLHAVGGIGRVWVARDTHLGRLIALKELRPDKAGNEATCNRFVKEARITGQLEHPGIVPVYELAQRPDTQEPFYTMRFVKGPTLTEAAQAYHQRRATSKVDSLEFLALLNGFVTVCNTIAYAHSRGVIHRDLKGANVLLGDFGDVVVLDWGVAKLVDRSDEEPNTAFILDQDASEAGLTVQGQAVGTPAHMAPEQAAGRLDLINRRTDVYGLGTILYEILTGQPPFLGSDISDVLRKVLNQEPIPPRMLWPQVPPPLESACLRAMAKNAEDRYSSASDLAEEVQRWQEVQRKEAEEERDRFFTLSLDLLCIAGFDGFFKRLNPAFERTFGFTTVELLAEPYINFVHPDDRESTAAEARRIMTGNDETISFENRYRCKDGSYKWMLWTATTFVDRRLIYAAARDITERKLVEEALRESEERYRGVIAAMQDGVVLVDANGGIRACNASAERILGLSAEQMMGRTSLDPRWRAIHEDSSPFPGDTFPAAVTLRTGQSFSNVVMGVHKPNGELTWISINSQPLFRPGETTPAGVVASFSDITERKRTELLLMQTASKLAEVNQQSRVSATSQMTNRHSAESTPED